MSIVKALPHWDMTVVYPSMESKEFAEGFSRVVLDIDDLAKLFDTHHLMKQSYAPALNRDTIMTFETVIQRYNAVLEASRTLSAYIMCFVTTNSHDTIPQARLSELQQSTMLLSQLGTRFTAWIGTLDVEPLIEQWPIACQHPFMLKKATLRAAHLIAPPQA